jgi:ATP-dependent exoDNAse (exonuclease V) alpha subunit
MFLTIKFSRPSGKNKMIIIKSINKDTKIITLKYKDNNNTINIEFNNFQKFFLPSYACTTHSAQGLTINGPYTIHEFQRMDQKLRYVALSRSKKYDYINIMK